MVRSQIGWALSLLAGLALWTVVAIRGHRIEPWDAAVYWSAGYPCAIALSGLLGYFWPDRPWRWAAVLMFSQVIVMLARGAGLSMFPLGLILLAVLSLPAIGVAELAARLARR
jgi:hypothetical protein